MPNETCSCSPHCGASRIDRYGVPTIDWESWVLMSRTYTTRQSMEHVVNAVRQTADSREVRYCRLRLKVEYGADEDRDDPFR
jgi:hypothetical protein